MLRIYRQFKATLVEFQRLKVELIFLTMRKYTIVLLFLTLMSSLSYSQSVDYGSAELSEPACIVLAEDEPLSIHYEMDLSVLGFTTEQEAQNWAGHYSNNLITLSVNFDAGKAYVQLHNERLAEAKDLTWWNAYLADLCTFNTNN